MNRTRARRSRTARKRRRPIRYLVAIHEAGHAVAAVALGLAVESVSIIPDAHTLGRVQPAPTSGKDEPKLLMFYVAGDVAATIHRRDGMEQIKRHSPHFVRPRASSPERPASDRKLIADISLVQKIRQDDRFMMQMLDHLMAGGEAEKCPALQAAMEGEAYPLACRTWDLLEAHWPAVLLLADELMLFGTVDGPRVAEIVAGVQSNRKGGAACQTLC